MTPKVSMREALEDRNVAKLEKALSSLGPSGTTALSMPIGDGGLLMSSIAEELAAARMEATRLREQLAEAEKIRGGLLRAPDAGFKPPPKTTTGGGEPDKAALKALEALRTAHRDLTESEIDAARRVRDERIAAIEAVGLKGAAAEEERRKANDLYAAQLVDINDKEVERAKVQEDTQTAANEREISMLDEVLSARDRAHGQLLSLMDREYERRKAKLEKEFADNAKAADDAVETERRKKAALKALEDEYEANKKDFEDRALGRGKYSENEVERLRAEQKEKLDLLDVWYAENLDREQEYLDRKVEINAQAEATITELRQAAMLSQLDAAEKGFGAAAGLAKKFAGENSAIYKAIFAAEKAAALASAYVQMNLAIAKAAAAAPPPANVPLIAAAKVTGMATIAGITASAIAGFKDGVINLKGPGTSRSDSIPAMLSKGESVINAAATRKNEGLLQAINSGVDVQGRLAGISRGVGVTPATFAPRQTSVNMGGFSLIVQGNVTEDTMPALRAEIRALERVMKSEMQGVVDRDRTRRTPRHERNRFFDD